MLRSYSAFDIETVPCQSLPDACIPKFDEASVKLGQLKDRFKIEEKINEERAKWQEKLTTKLSCDPDYCQVVAFVGITMVFDTGATMGGETGVFLTANTEDEEVFLLDSAWRWMSEAIRNGSMLVSYNGHSFDVPILARRAMLQDVSIDGDILQTLSGRYSHELVHTDLMRALASTNAFTGKPDYRRFDYYLKRFGLGGKKDGWDGSKVFPAWQAGQFQEILDYCEDDVRKLMALYERVRYWLPNGNKSPRNIKSNDEVKE